MFVTVRVFSTKVEQVDAGENDEKAAKQRDCVNGGGRVEALEQQA